MGGKLSHVRFYEIVTSRCKMMPVCCAAYNILCIRARMPDSYFAVIAAFIVFIQITFVSDLCTKVAINAYTWLHGRNEGLK